MNKHLSQLYKYLPDSEKNMSEYTKHHMLNKNYELETSLSSGSLVKANLIRNFKYLFAYVAQILIWKKQMFNNKFIKFYKKLCKQQSRIINYDLIIHGIVLDILNNYNILKNNVCVIGDGKANFVHALINIKNIKKIFSVNLPQALIQDLNILTTFKSINIDLIKIVENEKDLLDKSKKIFLIPAKNKKLLTSQNINLFVNMSSFQEMPLSEVHEYIDIAISNSSFLYSLNREEKILYDNTIIKYSDYNLTKNGKLIFEKEARFVKRYYNATFPFVHVKKSKLINTLVKYNETFR